MEFVLENPKMRVSLWFLDVVGMLNGEIERILHWKVYRNEFWLKIGMFYVWQMMFWSFRNLKWMFGKYFGKNQNWKFNFEFDLNILKLILVDWKVGNVILGMD